MYWTQSICSYKSLKRVIIVWENDTLLEARLGARPISGREISQLCPTFLIKTFSGLKNVGPKSRMFTAAD